MENEEKFLQEHRILVLYSIFFFTFVFFSYSYIEGISKDFRINLLLLYLVAIFSVLFIPVLLIDLYMGVRYIPKEERTNLWQAIRKAQGIREGQTLREAPKRNNQNNNKNK